MSTPNNFGQSIFDSAQVKAAPVNPTDVVRLQDMQGLSSSYATAAQVSSLQADIDEPPVQINPLDDSLVVTNPSQNDFGIRLNLVPGGSSGFSIIPGGLQVNFGYEPGQVADGADVLGLLDTQHTAATPDPTAVTTTTTISPSQQIKVEVNLVPQGGLSSTSAGLEVNLNLVEAAVIAALPYASSSSAGLMTAAQVQELGGLLAEGALNFETTNSNVLANDGNGNITNNTIAGLGITIGYVTTTGNTSTGLFNGENIWLNLSLTPAAWPAGWPNNLFWGIEVAGGIVTFSIFQDVTLLASGSMSAALLTAAGSPQLFILLNPSSIAVATVLVNTVSAWPVDSGQTINLQPQGVSIDPTVVALKSTTDAQGNLIDTLLLAASSDAAAITTLQGEVETLGQNTLSSAQYADFSCLSVLLEKWAYAHQFISTLRVESPNIGSLSGGDYPSPVMVSPRVIKASGTTGDIFTVNFQVLAVCKTKNVYVGNAAGSPPAQVVPSSGGRAVQNGTAYIINTSSLTVGYTTDTDSFRKEIEASLPGATDQYGTGEMISYSTGDTFLLTISDDGTGTAQNYYLNAALSNTESLGAPMVLNYLLEGINVKAGATVTLTFTSATLNVSHTLVVPGVPPTPSPFPGYFMQVDAYQVANTCSVGDTEDGGMVDGIAVPGSTARKDLALISPLPALGTGTSGYPALNYSSSSPGWNGPGALDPNGTSLTTGNGTASTLNQPAVALARDLMRLFLMDGGNADGRIDDILVSGNDIWVAGAFDRWGNRPCAGLVRLDQYGNLPHDFNNAFAGFTEPVRFLSASADGHVYAATLLPSCYQGQRSSQVHKILHDGTEDATFTCPAQLAINDGNHQNVVIGVQGLSDGRVAVLCPETLVILDQYGNILSQIGTDTEMFLSILGVVASPAELLLSSHAWASPGIPQNYNGLVNPKGLKLLSGGSSSFSLDGTWALAGASPAPPSVPPPGAGTGAQSTCMRAIAGPNNDFFIAGNGILQFNAIDTSWNCQILGNLLYYSEQWDAIGSPGVGVWQQVGTISVTGGPTPSGVTGNGDGGHLINTGGLGTQAYIYQVVPVASQVNCVFTFYVKKTVIDSTFPVVQMEFSGNVNGTGGTPITAYAWFDTELGVTELQNVNGGGNPSITMVTAPTDSGWWLVTMELFNNSTDGFLTVTLFPAYSSALGGTSTSVSGSIQVSAPSVEYDYWTQVYVPTSSTNSPPSVSTSNAARFQGLYKVEGPGASNSGAADPNFNCVMTYAGTGAAIPFCLDGYGNIYVGGPISSIMDASSASHSVTPWMLYKLNANGQFLQAYQLFDDAVTSCRIHPYGYLVVGGKFNWYGARSVGRFCIIDPVSGKLIDEEDQKSLVISSSSTPDTVQYPGAVKKLWLDVATDPPGVEVWSPSQNKWVDAASGGYPQLPPPTVSDSPSVPPNLWVPLPSGSGDNASPLTITLTESIAGATIWYTVDGTDPRIASGTRIQYVSPFTISTPTIITAYATKPGYADSLLTTAVYGEQLYAPTITPPTQNLTFPVAVTITGPAGATLKFTTDGTDPATSGSASAYSGSFNVGTLGQTSAITVRAVAVEAGYFNSPETQANYGDNIVPALTVTPAGGAGVPVAVTFALPASFTGPYSVVYTTSTTGVAPNPITNPTAATTVAGPLVLNLTVGTSIQAYATAPGWTNNGSFISASFGLVLATPTLTPASGVPSLIIISSVAGSTINYTLTNNATGITSAVVSGVGPLAVSLLDLGATTITAYASMSGWSNSATASLTAGPFYASGLINVNFAPVEKKVGRGIIWSDPFNDVWQNVTLNLVAPNPLVENFYGAIGTPQATGGAQGDLTVGIPGGEAAFSSLSFSLIPNIGDNAYKNVLNIAGSQHTGANFNSIAYGLGVFIATTPSGQIWTSPDAINWTIAVEGLLYLTKVRFFANATAIPPGTGSPVVTPMFVILGSNTSLVSFDGLTFTQVDGHPNGVTLYDCDIGNVNFAYTNNNPTNGIWAVGSGGIILNVTLTWAAPPAIGVWKRFTGFGYTAWTGNPTNANLKSIALFQGTTGLYPNGIWVGGDAGESGSFINSTTTYCQVNYGIYSTVPYYPGDTASVRSNGAYFVTICRAFNGTCFAFLNAVSDANLSTFTLGSPVAVPGTVTDLVDMVVLNNGTFVAVGGGNVILGTIASAALTWADITPAGVSTTFHAVTLDVNGGLIVTSDAGVFQNENAIPTSNNWTQISGFTPTALAQSNLLIGNFSGIPPGQYELVVAAHGASSSYYSSVNFYADYEFQGGGVTTSSASFDDTNWQHGRQYLSMSGLQTLLGEIGFGIAPTSTETVYIIKAVTWEEYAAGNTAAFTLGGTSTSFGFYDLAFAGGWPSGWPSQVYWSEAYSSMTGFVTLSFWQNANGTTLLATATALEIDVVSGIVVNIINTGSTTIGSIGLEAVSPPPPSTIAASSANYFYEVSGVGVLGVTPLSAIYSITSSNPGVSIGQEITALAQLGTPVSAGPPPTGTTQKRTATRYYLYATLTQGSGAFLNFAQLSSLVSGSALGRVQIYPESLTNLPYPKSPGGLDLVGFSPNASDQALGVAPVIQYFYRIDSISYANFLIYQSGTLPGGLAPDPTTSGANVGTLYTGPFPVSDDPIGKIVRVVAALPGRSPSPVAASYFWPSYPTSQSQGGG